MTEEKCLLDYVDKTLIGLWKELDASWAQETLFLKKTNYFKNNS